ncbi:hypothetical protein AAFG13_17560 [Bradyrhizobium sp. B124]|uniref:hypothetical protein n=1 Tax=Bradyrhizobium sp. B124 TaxID=3140245 RepID=UPI003182BA60
MIGVNIQRNRLPILSFMIWHHIETAPYIETAPFNRVLELAVVDSDGLHALIFPCCQVLGGW